MDCVTYLDILDKKKVPALNEIKYCIYVNCGGLVIPTDSLVGFVTDCYSYRVFCDIQAEDNAISKNACHYLKKK